jgi:DNA-binding transcriptional LysR family regulator
MLNWDDLKFFLAVCREGSVRSAANELAVNHSTVSRRINSFELALGQRLFERTSQGYIKTKLAEEIYNEASYLEERLNSVERKIIGRDNELSGDIRITLPELIGTELLMPGFAQFSQLYPQIEIDIVDSIKELNLANREADVAFRIVKTPPEYLVGRKVAQIHRACYLSKKLADKLNKPGWLEQQNWIGWTDKQRRPIGVIAKEYPRLASKHKIVTAQLQLVACKEGMGVAILPCFKGDIDNDLIRIPPYISEAKYDLWILSHPDMRKNNKIQTFVRFMTDYIETKRDLIEGRQCSY